MNQVGQKDNYKDLFEKIREIVNRHDPANLSPGSAGGAPFEEYDPETALIVAFVLHNLEPIKINRRLLIDKINQVWLEYFGEFCKFAEQISIDILNVCRNSGDRILDCP